VWKIWPFALTSWQVGCSEMRSSGRQRPRFAATSLTSSPSVSCRREVPHRPLHGSVQVVRYASSFIAHRALSVRHRSYP